MFILREYQEGDIFKIQLHKNEQYQVQYTREDLLIQSMAFTGVDGYDRVVGCAGLYEMWDGVYEAWVALDERYKREHISMLKIMKSFFNNLTGNVKRIHAHINEITENHAHFMKFLGFEMEAILPRYFPDNRSCILYRRLY